MKFTKRLLRSLCDFYVPFILTASLAFSLTGCRAGKTEFCYSGFAMDSEYSIKIRSDKKTAEAARALIDASAAELDDCISAFKENSVVSRLNRREEVSDSEIADAVYITQTSNRVSALCGGRYSVSSGSVTFLWKNAMLNKTVPDDNQIKSALAFTAPECLDISDGKITFNNTETKLDFGSVGKGYACEKAAEIFEKNNVDSAIASFGGSILIYQPDNNYKRSVAVRSPVKEYDIAGVIRISETRYISTSGAYERYLISDTKTYHHIIDLATGYPSDSGLSSVTVLCDSGVLADALSTACFIVGAEESVKILSEFDCVSAIFIFNDNTVKTHNLTEGFETASGFTYEGEL